MAGPKDLAEKFWYCYKECLVSDTKGQLIVSHASIDDGSVLQCAINVFKEQYGR